jgi:IrrE N-terminal-like domain
MNNTSDLRYFCYCLVRKYGSPDKISEEQKANEFRNHYLRELPLSLKTLHAITSSSGITIDSTDKMPKSLRGFNHVINGKNNIVIKNDDTVSGMQNTILHEIREIMEGIFPSLCRDYKPLKTNGKHLAANRFATAVLLPAESFTKKVYETGFDVIDLANYYSKSCSQVLLRIGEVLQGKLFFYAGMYEPDADNIWKVTYWTGSCNNEDPEANVYGLNGFFPRKGREIVSDSLVDLVINSGQSHLGEKVTLTDDTEEEGFTAIAQPLLIRETPIKVTLMVLLSRNKDLLEKQILRTNPVTLKGLHGHF